MNNKTKSNIVAKIINEHDCGIFTWDTKNINEHAVEDACEAFGVDPRSLSCSEAVAIEEAVDAVLASR